VAFYIKETMMLSVTRGREGLGIKPIDLVCVNLYPFKETTQRSNDFRLQHYWEYWYCGHYD